MVPSQVTTVQLTAVRALLDQALASATSGGPIGATVALLVSDVAVETLLKQVLLDLGGNADSAQMQDLTERIEKLDAAYCRLPEWPIARRLRKARNPVQHAGAVPNDAIAIAHVRDALSFGESVARQAYGVALSEVSLAELIHEPDIRRALQEAVKGARAGNADEACVYAAAAFGLLFARTGAWTRRLMGITEAEERFTPALLDFAVVEVFGAEHPDATTPKTEHAWWREMTLATLGLPLPELLAMKGLQDRARVVLEARSEAKAVAGDSPAADVVMKAV
jgi:hypothetical protein